MTPLDRLKEDFRRATVEYPWRKFVRLLTALGYEQMPNRRTTGSARTFYHAGKKRFLKDHEPHNGKMYRDLIKRVKETLKREGLL